MNFWLVIWNIDCRFTRLRDLANFCFELPEHLVEHLEVVNDDNLPDIGQDIVIFEHIFSHFEIHKKLLLLPLVLFYHALRPLLESGFPYCLKGPHSEVLDDFFEGGNALLFVIFFFLHSIKFLANFSPI